ncbi:MAG: hypothetical protein ABL860_08655 [Candidatus Nitrotoga sp.]
MTKSEYLNEVLSVIRKTFRSNDESGSMPVAAVAYLAKLHLGSDHTAFGFAKFKDVLQELEKQGMIRTGTNSKQAYSLWLSSSSIEEKVEMPKDSDTFQFNKLRNQVWFAFIAELPLGNRYLNRVTGEVRVGIQDPLSGDWLEIPKVPQSEQKTFAESFVESNALGENSEVKSALNSARWYSELPKVLSDIDPRILLEWKRARSRQIISYVERWRCDQRLNLGLVYEHGGIGGSRSQQSAGQNELRRILLSAISQMSTEDLLDFRVPMRTMLAISRPDLLNS